jgi:hypothetical protein
MTKRLASTFINAVYDAILKSFWRRKTLWRFLRQAGVADTFLASWRDDESKREFLDRLFARLPDQARGPDLILSLARDLAQQDAFPDLVGWEDSDQKTQEARGAINQLRRMLAKMDDQVQSESERKATRERFRTFQAEVRRSQETLESLNNRMTELATRLGSQQAGYDFQTWFYDLMEFFEVTNRRPYVTSGRQIDGSITVSGTTYLVELKFTGDQAEAPNIDTLLKKVADKADNTMGIMVSISGYSSTAISQASGPRTTLLLLDHRHLYLTLVGGQAFGELVDRIRRHASQTGESYLAPEQLEA